MQLAESWLLRLLVDAAQRHLSARDSVKSQNGDASKAMALLPALPEDSASSTEDSECLGFRLFFLLSMYFRGLSSIVTTAVIRICSGGCLELYAKVVHLA